MVDRNFNYWEVISTLAGEVAEPAKTFPRALGIALVLVVATYLLPTAASLGVYGGVSDDWELGFFATIASKVSKQAWVQAPPKPEVKASRSSPLFISSFTCFM